MFKRFIFQDKNYCLLAPFLDGEHAFEYAILRDAIINGKCLHEEKEEYSNWYLVFVNCGCLEHAMCLSDFCSKLYMQINFENGFGDYKAVTFFSANQYEEKTECTIEIDYKWVEIIKKYDFDELRDVIGEFAKELLEEERF